MGAQRAMTPVEEGVADVVVVVVEDEDEVEVEVLETVLDVGIEEETLEELEMVELDDDVLLLELDTVELDADDLELVVILLTSAYISSLPPPPQYSFELPLQTMLHPLVCGSVLIAL
jgi:hypothetical protein